MRWYIMIFTIAISLAGCKSHIQKAFVGKWYSDMYWFEFVNDSLYRGGIGGLTQVEDQYVLNAMEKILTMHDRSQNKSYDMKYNFVHKDTLELTNLLLKNAKPAIYYRKP